LNTPEKVNVVWHPHKVQRSRGCVVWFTGLSGCGKSTIASEVDHLLHGRDVGCTVLDGDNVRHGLNASPEILSQSYDDNFSQRFGLGFGPVDRQENIRRIGCVSELFCAAGIITLAAFVSPYRDDRDQVRKLVTQSGGKTDFVEVYVNAPLDVCEARDPKGLYKKARAGEIKNFTGIGSPYEPPLAPELELLSHTATPDVLAVQVVNYLEQIGKLSSGSPTATTEREDR
jgi:adenylylsulfate kinase